MPERKTFWVESFGCRASQADGAALEADLVSRGLIQAAGREYADLVVLNTCTVTAEADADARQTIRRVHRDNPSSQILVTGCYAQRKPADVAGLSGVEWVVGNSHKSNIGELVAPAPSELVSIEGSPLPYHGGVLLADVYKQRELLTAPILDAPQDRSRPNLKVQDGCNNLCTFCIIPSVRGYSRSAPPEFVVGEIRKLEERFPEIVLTGINLGRWGRDLPGRPRFHELLDRIMKQTDVRKIRISSVEPMDWTGDLLATVAAEPRIAKHMHIPLQSASDEILRSMRRRYRARHYADRITRARKLMPDAAIGADVMVGFPGETDERFEETRRFIEENPFTYLHVFSYSAREHTPAADMPHQVPKKVKKERNRILRELITSKHEDFVESLVGRTFEAVTLDRESPLGTAALTDNFLHIDILDEKLRPAQLVEVEISDQGVGRLADRKDSPAAQKSPLPVFA